MIGGRAELLVYSIPILLVLGWGFWTVWRLGRKRRAARRWPRVGGKIVAAALRDRWHTVLSRAPAFGQGRPAMPELPLLEHEVHVTYAYRVDGRAHSADLGTLDGPRCYRDRATAERALASYRPGMSVTVSYDPERPEQGIIDLTAPPEMAMLWRYWGIAAVICLGAVAGLLLFEPKFGGKSLAEWLAP